MICCENVVDVVLLKKGLVEKKGVLITKVMAKWPHNYLSMIILRTNTNGFLLGTLIRENWFDTFRNNNYESREHFIPRMMWTSCDFLA